MKRFGTGLVVGKFCPLHHGHQRLLDQAQLQCSELVVISYTKPEFAGCEPDRRDRWLASLYPNAVRLVLDRGASGRTLPPIGACGEDAAGQRRS